MEAERVAAVERLLEVRGCVVLPATLWPGASSEGVERALEAFYEVVMALELEVERLGDGTRIAFRLDTPEDERESLRRAAASGN